MHYEATETGAVRKSGAFDKCGFTKLIIPKATPIYSYLKKNILSAQKSLSGQHCRLL